MALFRRGKKNATRAETLALALGNAYRSSSQPQKIWLLGMVQALVEHVKAPEAKEVGRYFAEFAIGLLPSFALPVLAGKKTTAIEKALLALYEKAPELRDDLKAQLGDEVIEKEVADARKVLGIQV